MRKDCHVHVEGNFYSVPHGLVGQKVLVRRGETSIEVLADGRVVASHPRARGVGENVTDRTHYPEEKRTATQEVFRQRVLAVREAGPHAAEFLHRLREGRTVQGDQVRRLARLAEEYGAVAFEQACRRALFFGAHDTALRIQAILERGLHDAPLPGLPPVHGTQRDFGRELAEYGALLRLEA